MCIPPRICRACVVITLAMVASPSAISQESAPASRIDAGAAPDIEPQADRILREMSDYLGTQSEFTFRAEIRYDVVGADGQKIEYGGVSDVAVRRPDRLHAHFEGDERHSRLLFDGSTVTIHDIALNAYAVMEVPPEIGAALDTLFAESGFSAPAADLVYPDPYGTLIGSVETGLLVGRHPVDGTPCHHLAFTQETIDWQVWIEDGPRPLPRRLIITHKDEPGAPQYSATLSHWDLHPSLSETHFRFHPPAGADKIEFLPVEDEEYE